MRRRVASGTGQVTGLAVPSHRAAHRPIEQVGHPQQRALAGPGRPDHRQQLARLHLEALHIQDRSPAGIDGDPLQRQQAHARPRCCTRVNSQLMPQRDEQQHHPQRHRQAEVPLPGLEDDGGGHHPRLPLDVAAHHHHRADLRDDAAEPRRQRRHQRQPRLLHQLPVELHARGPERQDLQPQPLVQTLDRGQRDTDHERPGDDHLRHHHGAGRVEQVEAPERSRAGQQQEHGKAHHDRRQPHPRVDQSDHQVAAGKTVQPQEDPHRHPERHRDHDGDPGHPERQPDDLDEVRQDHDHSSLVPRWARTFGPCIGACRAPPRAHRARDAPRGARRPPSEP